MFFSVYHNASGQEWIRRVGPNASLEILRDYVHAWAQAQFDGELVPSFSEPGSHIPNGCGEYQAEIRRTKASNSLCWYCEPFYLESASA